MGGRVEGGRLDTNLPTGEINKTLLFRIYMPAYFNVYQLEDVCTKKQRRDIYPCAKMRLHACTQIVSAEDG